MAFIHPTAYVEEPAAVLDGCRIDAFAVVEAGVELGRDVHILPHAVVHSGVRLADGVQVGSQSVIGGAPQDLSYDGSPTEVTIGALTVIREFVTIHRSTGSSPTSVGANALIMGQVHIAHDCVVGDNVIIAQGTKLAGHVRVGDRAVLGGMAGILQWVQVGECSFVGAMAKVGRDVLPYLVADGAPAQHLQVNAARMRRQGYTAADIASVRRAVASIRAGRPIETGAGGLLAVLEHAISHPSGRGVAPFRPRGKPPT